MQATLSTQLVGSPMAVPLRPACGRKATSTRCLPKTVHALKAGHEAETQKKGGWLAAAGVFGALVAAQLVLAPLQSAEAVSLPGSDVKKSDLGAAALGTPTFDDIENNPAGKSRAYTSDKPEAKLRPRNLEKGVEGSNGSLKNEDRPGFLNPLKQ